MFFEKYKNKTIKITECSLREISAIDIMYYFKYLTNKFKIFDLDYDIEHKRGEKRCIIKTGRYNQKAINYFNDRCPAIIEYEIKKYSDEMKKHNDIVHTSQLKTEVGNLDLKQPTIVMYPIKGEGIIDYTSVLNGKSSTKVKFGNGKYPYSCLPYVYQFVISVPENNKLALPLNRFEIKKFFVDSFSSNFNAHVLEENIMIDGLKDIPNPNCARFFLKVDPGSDLNEFLQKIDVDNPIAQLDNELNIKLRKYLHFPI